MGGILPSQKFKIFKVFYSVPAWGLFTKVVVKSLYGFPETLDILCLRKKKICGLVTL